MSICDCPKEMRSYVPHRTALMVLACERCGGRKPSTKSVSHYNQKRRQLRVAQQLVSVSAPLDAGSALFVADLAASHRLTSNTAMPHVTFVEGLQAPPPPSELHELCVELARRPELIVVGAKCVPTRREKGVLLVCLALGMGDRLCEAARALAAHDTCRLPQWPLHVALGTAPAARAKQSARTLQLISADRRTAPVLRVAPEHIAVLDPLWTPAAWPPQAPGPGAAQVPESTSTVTREPASPPPPFCDSSIEFDR